MVHGPSYLPKTSYILQMLLVCWTNISDVSIVMLRFLIWSDRVNDASANVIRKSEPETLLHVFRIFSITNDLYQSCNTHKAHYAEFTNSSTRRPILFNVIFCTRHSCRSCQTSLLLLIQISVAGFHSNFPCQILFFHLLSPYLHPRQSFYVSRLFP